MEKKEIKCEFSAKPWISGWVFVSMPEERAIEIRENFRMVRRRLGTNESHCPDW